jgi:Mn-containing catalase
MFAHNKRLQYTVRVSETNPGLANLMLEQFGGPQGELAAACRYFTQYLAEDDPGRRDMLIDIATEELSHLEVIGTIVAMLNKGAKARVAEAVEAEAELYRNISGGGNSSHVTQVLYGAGPALTNSGGVPWTAAYVDTIGDPTCDLRSNIAAEARAKIIYERLINLTDDPGVKEALGFLMTREIAHQQSFEKALYSIQPNFPPGKLAGVPEFTNVYFNMSVGEGDARGPWNNGGTFEFRDAEPAVDGGTGLPEVKLSSDEKALAQKLATRLRSDPDCDPVTGAMLGMNGVDADDAQGLGEQATADPQAAKTNAEAQQGDTLKAPDATAMKSTQRRTQKRP